MNIIVTCGINWYVQNRIVFIYKIWNSIIQTGELINTKNQAKYILQQH